MMVKSQTPEMTIEGLTATKPEPLSFAPHLSIRSYLLERENGNVLIYATSGLAEEAELLLSRGGADRHFLGHGHEASFGSAPAELGARLVHHRDDAPMVERALGSAGATFDRRHAIDDDLEVIPIPGHTPGSTAYLWRAPAGERLLFTADSLILTGDAWVPAVLESSDAATYLESLELLREVEFDVVVPWAAAGDGPPLERVDEVGRTKRLEGAISRVRRKLEG